MHGTWYPSKVVCLQGLQAVKPTAMARQAPSGQPRASALPLGLSLGVTVSHLVYTGFALGIQLWMCLLEARLSLALCCHAHLFPKLHRLSLLDTCLPPRAESL